jgi:hypothetical protein
VENHEEQFPPLITDAEKIDYCFWYCISIQYKMYFLYVQYYLLLH